MYISLIASVAAFFLWPALERWCAGKGAGKELEETMNWLNVDVWVRCFVPMAIVVLMRKFAWSNGLRLPIYRWHVR